MDEMLVALQNSDMEQRLKEAGWSRFPLETT